MSDSVLPIFSSKSFIISGLTFSSKWFEFIFVCGVRKYYFILLHIAMQVLPGPLTEETIFSPLYILASFVKDKLPCRCLGLSLGFVSCSIGLYFCFCARNIYGSYFYIHSSSLSFGWSIVYIVFKVIIDIYIYVPVDVF